MNEPGTRNRALNLEPNLMNPMNPMNLMNP